jgi:hypothetical protein
MFHLSPHRRRIARDVARAGAALSAVMLAVSIAASIGVGDRAADAAAVNAGTLQLQVPSGPTIGSVLTSGGSATAFALTPPDGASCTGDSATDGYRVQTYIVPAAVSPATLTFDSNGPTPNGTGANLRLPLFATTGTPIIDRTTAVATAPGAGGLITGIPTINFAVFGSSGPTVVPAGQYNVGFACTLGNPGPNQVDKYWNVVLTFAVTPSDSPSGISWTVAASTPTTTTTAAPTTTAAGATTTTAAGATTTTVEGATTTVAGDTTTTEFGSTDTTLVDSGAGSGGGSGFDNGGTLPNTGASPIPIVVWGVLLLVFGRMALLLARPLKVIPLGAA